MFKTVEQLKDFITWAKAQKIREVHVGKVVVVFSEFALAEAMVDTPDYNYSPGQPTEERNTSKTLVDEPGDEPENDDELIDWSSK